MQDYVVYHNPDKMHTTVIEIDAFLALTNKKVADERGSRVGVVTGEGKPRTFFLRSYFFVNEIGPGARGFKTKLSGAGEVFEPMIRLNDLEWFDDLKLTQGKFSLGFNAITETRLIKGLEAAAAGAE